MNELPALAGSSFIQVSSLFISFSSGLASGSMRPIGEGTSFLDFKDFREDGITWKPDDIRYVRKGNVVYAFLMGAEPGKGMVLRRFDEGERVKSVKLLGVGEVPFVHQFGVLTAQLPERLPTEYVPCLAIELE